MYTMNRDEFFSESPGTPYLGLLEPTLGCSPHGDVSESPHDFPSINRNWMDELGLSNYFNEISIREEQNDDASMKGYVMYSDRLSDCDDGSFGGNVQYNVDKYRPYSDFNHGDMFNEGFPSSSCGVPMSSSDDHVNGAFIGCFQDRFKKGFCEPLRLASFSYPYDEYSGSGWYDIQGDYLLEQRKEQGKSFCNREIPLENASGTRPYFHDALVRFQKYQLDSNAGRGVMDPLSSPPVKYPLYDLNVYDAFYKSLILQERTRPITNNMFPRSFVSPSGKDLGAFIQKKGLNPVPTREPGLLGGENKISFNDIYTKHLQSKSIKLNGCNLNTQICESGKRPSIYSPLPEFPSSYSSLGDIQGYIYLMAQDQNGCRLLQRIFDEGTSQDVQIVFTEIVDHVVELMLKPFGNYVVQKLLDVCSEEQRLQIVHMVTQEQGQLARICLNTYGTRVVQKLIETIQTVEQISLVVSGLKHGFLELIKDQNGNHVLQRCLQCLSNEDNKFMFDAAAKCCVQIATHRHGCCVMQRCIAHATGKHRDKLMTEISRNSLYLAQDPYGNYVVQYVIEQKSPSTVPHLLSLFKGHYVRLSRQKFSSHVVEKCLKHFEESRAQIVRELLSVSHFEQLLQDPYANYVIQSALAVTKDPLRSALVQAVQPHDKLLRTSPYCRRIFSGNFLKK